MVVTSTYARSTGEGFAATEVQTAGREALALLAEAERLTIQAVEQLQVADRAGLAELWGYVSTERMVAHRARRTNREGRDLVAVSRHLGRHPDTAAALAAGEISLAQAGELVAAARGFDDAYTQYEDQLLDACRSRDPDAVPQLARLWRDRCDDQKAAEDAEHRFDHRGVYLQNGLDGSCKGSFQLDPVGAETLRNALETRPDSSGCLHEPRSLAQRRADKLVEICHRSLHGPGDDDGHHGSPDDEGPDAIGSQDVDRDHASTTGDELSRRARRRGRRPDLRLPPPAAVAPGGGGHSDLPAGRCSGAAIAADVIIDIETLAGEMPTEIERLRSELASGAPIAGPALDRLLCRFHHGLVHDGGWQLGRAPDGEITVTSP
jgi:hypothetical protein